MAFVAEDGTGLADANSLISVSYADSYFTLRANTTWSALNTSDKQKHLVLATDYIEYRYGTRFIGKVLVDEQSLSWPRELDTEFPDRVKKAVCEYAILSAQSKLVFNAAVSSDGQLIKRRRDRFVQFEEEVHFENGRNGAFLPHPIPDALLAPYIKRGGQVIR